jgi:hypothetical protein
MIGLVPLGGCSGIAERRWSEEVALDDGSFIVIDRYAKFKESNSLAGDAYSSTTLKSTLSFTGELSKLPPWDVALVPLVLYRDHQGGEWVIVAATYSCEVWAERGSPAPPYWEFRLKADGWSQSSLSQTSIGREANLFFNFEPPLKSHSLSREWKRDVVKHSDFAKEYRGIGAEVRSNCMPVQTN